MSDDQSQTIPLEGRQGEPTATPSGATRSQPSKRVQSIDALRGFDMLWLMQEGPGLILALAAVIHLPHQDVLAQQLDHSAWQGFTFWDFIAPLFLFVVGLSLPFAISRRLTSGESRTALVQHVLKRTATLIVLGLLFNGILQLDFSDFRYTGVLQRIALSYVFAALITIFWGVRGQAFWTAALLLGYWAAMALVPVPGFGSGVYTPQGNLAGYLDRLFLPGKFCCYVYGDNEGYLSTIPSIATVMLGVLCGHVLGMPSTHHKKLQMLLGGGILSLGSGLLWSLSFPIITRLWTSSYALYANGWSMLLFALFYWLIDVRGYQKFAFPFIVIGLNALTIYVIQNLFDFAHVANIFVAGLANHAGSYRALLLAASIVAVKWLFLYFLYKQKIFLKA